MLTLPKKNNHGNLVLYLLDLGEKMKRNITSICLFTTILTLTCVAIASAQIYYPTDIGNEWVLESEDRAERVTYSIEASEETINEKNLALLKIQHETIGTDSITAERYFVDFDEEGIKLYKYEVELGDPFGVATGLLYPPILFYPLTLEVGDTWEFSTETEVILVGPVLFTSISKVVDKEEVETPAGIFKDCLKITIRTISEVALSRTRSTSHLWLAPDFGPVKFENSQDIVYTLVSSNLLPNISDYDVTGDGVINILDLVYVAARFGEDTDEGDVNNDGKVNILDLTLVAKYFGIEVNAESD